MVNCTGDNSLMDKECTDTGDGFTFSYFEYDNEPYFDMDLTLPSHGNDSPLEANRKSEEFEFSVSDSSTNEHNITEYVANVSPADDLFYRGQLLPLHLPLRLEMVRNLSLPKELEGHRNDSERYSLGSSDSNQTSGCCKESRCRFAETEEKTHFQSMPKSATKLKVKVPMFGFSKFSKVGIDGFDYSPPLTPPSIAKPLRFMVKFQSMKAASLPLLTIDYSTKQNPDYPFNNSRTNTSAKHIVQKYVRLVKHRISSQRHDDGHTGDQQLKVDEGCVCSSVADESGRQSHEGFRHFDAESCLPSMNSSPSLCSEDLQSAIEYCKQSNGVFDSSMDFECPA